MPTEKELLNLNLRYYQKHSKWSQGKMVLLLMTIPSFVFVLIFAYGPILGWVYAFFDYRIGMKLSQCEFKGLYFVKIALSDPDLLRVLQNTLAISFLSLLGIPLAAVFAIFLSQMKGMVYRKFVQSATTLPYFISWVIVFSITFSLFAPDSGLINQILMKRMSITVPLNPIANGDIAWLFQSGLTIWKNIGYNSIIFFSSIAGIDLDLYEASDIDGAGRYRKIWNITVPGIMPTFVTLLLINVGFMLSNGFDQFYVFMNPMVQRKIEVLDYYVYKVGMQNNDVPVSTALSMAKTVVSVTMLFFTNWISKKVRGQSVL